MDNEITKTIDAICEKAAKEFFKPEYTPTTSETLGVVIARYCKWDSSILDVFLHALIDANFPHHRTVAKWIEVCPTTPEDLIKQETVQQLEDTFDLLLDTAKKIKAQTVQEWTQLVTRIENEKGRVLSLGK